MRLTLWILPFALSAALLTTTSYVFADSHATGGEQHEPLDDAALEEEYGIKAGAVKRDEEDSAEQPSGDDESNGDEVAEGGTGGTGSSDDAIENGEDEESTDDDGVSEESTDDNE